MNHLKTERAVFETSNYAMNVGGLLKRINLNGSDMNVTVIASFEVASASIIPNFQHTGIWYDYFSGQSISVTNTSEAINLQPGEYHLYTDVPLPTPNIVLGMEQLDPQNTQNSIWSVSYPNPSSDAFVIEYEVAKPKAAVTITIYDLLGKKIATLYEGNQTKGGYQSIWNAQGLANGLYFYQINVDEATFVGRLMLQ